MFTIGADHGDQQETVRFGAVQRKREFPTSVRALWAFSITEPASEDKPKSMELKEMLFKHAPTTLEFSKGTQRQRGDKKIREKAEKKKWGRINNRTQRGADENQTKQVTCAPAAADCPARLSHMLWLI